MCEDIGKQVVLPWGAWFLVKIFMRLGCCDSVVQFLMLSSTQILMFGKVLSVPDLCKKIENVKPEVVGGIDGSRVLYGSE